MASKTREFPSGILVGPDQVSRPMDWPAQFGNDHPLFLEIGFGLGEFLIRQAAESAQTNFIGIEQDWSRIRKCLQKISGQMHEAKTPEFGKNIRLLKIDAAVALHCVFVPRSLNEIACLFPCPWPKKSHTKYRLFSRPFLSLVNSRLRDGARLRIVTDWKPYLNWMREQVPGSFEAQVKEISAQFGTKFERKWQRAGQDRFWELSLTKTRHEDITLQRDVELKAYFTDQFVDARFQFDNIVGEPAVIFKDFIFDPVRQRGLVWLVVAEKLLTQNLWVSIVKLQDRWCVARAQGHNVLPTEAVALAIEKVFQAVCQTARS